MDEELARKFPKMKPLNGTPTLFTLNGFGLSMYGKRNVDQETGTYIATRFITLLFMPIFAVGSYRVADAEGGGWYFLGKEGMSKLWQILNKAVLGLIIYSVVMIFWSIHTSSPDYRQGKVMELVEAHEKGDVLESMNALLEVEGIGGKLDNEVTEKLKSLAIEGVSDGSWEQVQGALQLVSSNQLLFGGMSGFYNDLSAAGEARISGLISENYESGHQMTGQMIRLMAAQKHESVAQFQKHDRRLLETLAADPGANIRYAVQLAKYYEVEGDQKRCKELLEPRIKELNGTEGARILGQIFVSEGNHEVAYPLLAGYVLPKLEKLKKASDRFNKISDSSYNKALAYLNDGEAPESFYKGYEKASEEEQAKMANEMIAQRMNRDRSYVSALESLQGAGEVVPVAMDFGIIQLRRAQGLSDVSEKADLLASAEKTFLALQTVAGDSEDYQLSLGQVYFWMGRMDEGEKLFQTARESSGESAGMLYSQGSIYRQLGDSAKGLALLKQAHGKAKTKEEGYGIAGTIAVMCDDSKEEIEWLKKCDQESIDVKIGLSNAEGGLAYSNGEYDKALKHYENAHNGYKQMPDSAANFNNHSLVMQSLYSLTGKPSYYQQSVDMMDEAVKLMPNNSILLGNALSQVFTSATIDLLSKKFSAEFVKEMRGHDSLRILYNDEDERVKVRSELLANESAKRGFKYLGAMRVLAPKSDLVHSTGLAWYWTMGMDAEIQASYKEMAASTWELDPEWKKDQDDLLAGKKDKEYLDSLAQVEKYDARVREKITNDDEWTLYQTSNITRKLNTIAYGGKVDYEALLKLSQQAVTKYPSSYTKAIQRDVFLARGLHSLSKSQSKVKALLESHGRLLGDAAILMILTQSDDETLKKAIINHPDIIAYLKGRSQSVILFPKSVTREDHYFSSLLGSSADLPEVSESDPYLKLRDEAAKSSLYRYPRSIAMIMRSYWRLKLSGKGSEAQAIYDNAKKEGVALPSLNE